MCSCGWARLNLIDKISKGAADQLNFTLLLYTPSSQHCIILLLELNASTLSL